MAKHEAIEEERVRQHRANTARLNIIIAMLMLIAAYIAIIISLRGTEKTFLDPQKLFHGNGQAHVYAQATTQDARLPAVR